MPPLTVGAYAAAGGVTGQDEDVWYGLLAELPGVGGLEAPFRGAAYPDGLPDLARLLPGGWHVVVTLLPLTYAAGRTDPNYGLAATDEEGRVRATADAAAAREGIRRLHDTLGRAVVRGVQLHSAPSRHTSDASCREQFRRSLDLLAADDWDGAELVVEHCDAAISTGWQKGYLSLADEIAAVEAAGGRSAGLGQSVNWGRSAIEGRSAGTPVEHLAALRERGTLRGLMLSGAAATDGPYGAAWRDVHNPAGDVDGHSLLDDAAMAAALAASGDVDELLFIGVKVAAPPAATTLAERLEGLRSTIAGVARAADAPAQLTA